MVRGFFSRFLSDSTVRETGDPTSSNGASSFHLIWSVPPEPLDEVSVTFELLVEPSVARLYFWALQATFVEGAASRGGAHLGMQWHPSYAGSRAVNWGGYGDSGELQGSSSALPSSLGNANTRDFPWKTGVPYRLRISSPEPGLWRGMVTDLVTGDPTIVRDLYSVGTHLAAPTVWTEAFCRCDDPPAMARWSSLRAIVNGAEISIESVLVNYQSYTEGGCTNTTVRSDDVGLVQITGTEREVPQGRVIPV